MINEDQAIFLSWIFFVIIGYVAGIFLGLSGNIGLIISFPIMFIIVVSLLIFLFRNKE